MTKLQILQGYSNRRIRDAWVALGENKLTDKTKIFTQNMIYQINFDGSSLNGSLLFCKQDYSGLLNWSTCKVIDGSGEITFGNDIISPVFHLLLLKQDLDQITEPIDYDFTPFTEKDTADIKIPEDIYDICLQPLGYPFITEDELEYTRDQIMELAVKPALIRYFKWFPKLMVQQVTLSGKEQEVEYPTNAYGVEHFSVQQGSVGLMGSSSGEVSNTFLRYFDEMMYIGGMGAGITGSYNGLYSPTTQTSTVETLVTGRAAQQAYTNYSHRYSLHTVIKEDGKRYLNFYSNKRGRAQITWAMQTYDWNDTELARRTELIKLIQAEIKLLFANLRRLAKGDIPGKFDYDTWIREANEDIKAVDDDWKQIVKFSGILRGSM